VTKLEEVARAIAIYQFGSPDSWEDQIPMARTAVEALRELSDYQNDALATFTWHTLIDAILSEKPE
jgi:hypothetical protein